MFLSTFVYFTALLILSSGFYHSSRPIILFNLIFIVCALLSFGLGNLSPNLGIFRGVAVTFFVFYLLLKWVEIKWGELWSIGLLGAGLFIYGSCVFIKDHVEYFISS